MVTIVNDYLIESWGTKRETDTYYIYTITCTKNNKVYVGRTQQPRYRFMHHRTELKAGHHENINMQRDYNEYGDESFQFEIIHTSESIYERAEPENIRKFKSFDPQYGYNDCPCARKLRRSSRAELNSPEK